MQSPFTTAILVFLGLLGFGVASTDAATHEGVIILSATACCAERSWSAAEQMVQKELLLLGIESKRFEAKCIDAPEADEEIVRLAVEHRADAVISLFLAPESTSEVMVRIYDRITDKTTFKTWRIDSPDAPDAAIITGLRVVDTLRASLLETQMEKQVKEPKRLPKQVGKLAATTEVESRRLTRFYLGLGWAQGGTPKENGLLLFGFESTLGWRPFRYGSLQLSATYLPIGKDITANEETSTINLLIIRGWLVWHVHDRGPVRPDLSVGGGSLIAFAEGVASATEDPVADLSRVGCISVGGALRFPLSDRIFVKLDVKVGMAIPAVRLEHQSQVAVELGRPLLDGLLSLELRLP